MAELRQRRRQGRIEYKQPDGSWSTKKPPAKKGGALAKTEQAKPENPRRTQARAKQAEAAKGTKGADRVGQPEGSANRKYGANRVNAAVSRAQRSAAARSATKLAGRVTLPLAIINQIADIARVAKENQRFSKYKKEEESKKAAQSGQYGRYGQPSSQVKSEKDKPAPAKPAAKPAPKPAAKPAPKPKPAAAKTAPKPAAKEYYGPGGKPKRASLKEQVADLKKSGTGSQRFKEMAEKARKEMMEKRKKQSKSRSTGSRKPGSMY
jgi:hypothetical protein